jgi:hypothetical protein
VSLPEDALAKLRQPHLVVHVADIWWVPAEHVDFPGGKDRFGLVVALEYPPGESTPTRAHFIAGSTRGGSQPCLEVQKDEAGLNEFTYFCFWRSSALDLATLVDEGKWRGGWTGNASRRFERPS